MSKQKQKTSAEILAEAIAKVMEDQKPKPTKPFDVFPLFVVLAVLVMVAIA